VGAVSTDPARRHTLLIGILLVGALVRLAAYVAARSLWLDESMLAINIVGHSFGGLLHPLAESQTAPWLFLWIEHAIARMFGLNEPALRLLPFVAGLALPLVVWRVALRCADETSAVIAACVAALSPLLVYYSNEVKPYEVDALATASLVLATLRVIEAPNDRRRWTVVIVGGAIAILLSFPAVFVLAACGLTLVASRDVRASPVSRLTIPLAAAAWGAAFALPYLLVFRAATTDDFLQTFFRDRFLATAHAWRLFQDLVADGLLGLDAVRAMPNGFAAVFAAAMLPLVCVGVYRIAQLRGAPFVLLIVGPMVSALVASALKLYPITPRLWTFAAPLWSILLAAGIAQLARSEVKIAAALSAAVLLPALYDATLYVAKPYWRRTHIRPLITALRDTQRSAHEPIYVSARAVAQWRFYTTDWNASDAPPVDRDSARTWLQAHTCSEGCQILGEASNIDYVEGNGFEAQLDPAWAGREIATLRAVAKPCGWLLMHLPYPGESRALQEALAAQGGAVDNALEDRAHPNRETSTRAFHICFR
jgi:hypothetical protein